MIVNDVNNCYQHLQTQSKQSIDNIETNNNIGDDVIKGVVHICVMIQNMSNSTDNGIENISNFHKD